MKSSLDRYLYAIRMLKERYHCVRAVDAAHFLGLSKASVSRAVSKLKQEDYILIDRDGYIALTEKGHELAARIYERHIVLTKMLVDLGVDEETAVDDACRMEHVISDASFAAIKEHIRTKHALDV